MSRILLVIDSLGSGGAQRQLVNLAVGFKQQGHDVSFLVYHENNFFKKTLEEARIPVTQIIEASYIRRLFKLRRYIRQGNFDSVLSFLEAANFICEFAGLPWRKWKLVVGERSANPKIFKSFKLRFYRWFHLFATYVVSNSHENIRMVRKANPLLCSKKCKVIYNLVDAAIWKADPDYVPLKDDKVHLIVAASHQYLKNAKGLIEAVKNLESSERMRLRIEWYGDESPDNSFKDALRLVKNYSLEDVFTFHSAIPGIEHKMKFADAIGLFSFYEGLPNVICEAIMIGKPFIASAVSDIPRMIKNEMLLFNPYHASEITAALSYLISLSKEELICIGKGNKILNEGLFLRDEVVNRYLDLLN